jgi:hypothetical protein
MTLHLTSMVLCFQKVFIIPEIKPTILFINTDITFVEIFFIVPCDKLWFRSLSLYVKHKHGSIHRLALHFLHICMVVIRLQHRSFDWPESSTWERLWNSHALKYCLFSMNKETMRQIYVENYFMLWYFSKITKQRIWYLETNVQEKSCYF